MFRSMLQNAMQEGRQLHPTQSPQFRGQTSGRNHFVVLEGAYGLLNFVLLQTKGILSRRSSVRFLPAKSSLEVVLYSPELLVLHQKVTVRRAYCSVVYTSPRREDPDNSVHLTDLALLCSLMSKIYEVLESLSPDLPAKTPEPFVLLRTASKAFHSANVLLFRAAARTSRRRLCSSHNLWMPVCTAVLDADLILGIRGLTVTGKYLAQSPKIW